MKLWLSLCFTALLLVGVACEEASTAAAERTQRLALLDSAKAVMTTQPLVATQLVDSLLPFFQAEDDVESRSIATRVKGGAAFTQGDYPSAVRLFSQAEELAEAANRTDLQAAAMRNKAAAYLDLGDYDKALAITQTAYALDLTMGDSISAAIGLMTAGNIASARDKHLEAIQYFKQSLHLNAGQDDVVEAVVKQNMGRTYRFAGNVDSSVYLLESLIPFFQGKDNAYMLANHYVFLSDAYRQKGVTNQAIAYADSSLNIAQQLENRKQMATAELSLAEAYLINKDFDKARSLFLRVSSYQNIGSIHLKDSYKGLLKISERTGDYKSGIQYAKNLYELNDSLYDKGIVEELAKQRTLFEFKQQEAAKALADAEAAEQERRAGNLQYLLAFTTILGLLLTVFFVSRAPLPDRLFNGLVYLSLLLLFEFTLVYLDPLIQAYTGSLPLPILLANTVLAAIFALAHGSLEGLLKKRRKAPGAAAP